MRAISTQAMHTLIMGDKPLKLDIDHRLGDGLDNKRHMIGFCTHQENMMNRKPQKNSYSKYIGVCWDNHAKKLKAQIRVDGKQKNLGYFDNEIDAALAYDAAAKKRDPKFARLNFPDLA